MHPRACRPLFYSPLLTLRMRLPRRTIVSLDVKEETMSHFSCNNEWAEGKAKPEGGEFQPCPVCGGILLPTRGQMRCRRCTFTLCLSCEVDPGDGSNAGQND